MPVKIGNIELPGVQEIHAEERRSLVEQHVLGQAGNSFQDLGREPIGLVVEGLIFGDDSSSCIEKLRQAHAKAEPIAFSSDIAVGTDIADVLIEDFEVRQAAGYRNRYHFKLRLREHVEPPESLFAALASVNAGVAAGAASWAGSAMGAASALQYPGSLSDLLAFQPGILGHLDMADLGGSISNLVNDLAGEDFGNILKSISDLDPSMAMDLMGSLKDAGSLGKFIKKIADEALDLAQEWIEELADIGKGLIGGADFLKRLKEISDSAAKLVSDVADLDLLGELRPLLEPRSS